MTTEMQAGFSLRAALRRAGVTCSRNARLAGAILLAMAGTAQAAPTVYIPLGSGNQVIAVDAATDRITARYPGVQNPHGLVATPDGEYLIAGSLVERPSPAGGSAETPNSQLFLIHPEHGHVMAEIPVAGWTHHQAITPDGRYVISTHTTRGGISLVDMQSRSVVKTIATGTAPNYAVVSKNGKRVFVTNTGASSISEVDLESGQVVRSLESGPAPEHMVMAKDGKTLFVTNPGAGQVTSVSIDTGKTTNSWRVAASLHGLDISDDGKTLFVTSRGDGKLIAIDIASGATRERALAPAPYHLNTITGTGKVYVSTSKESKIWVVDQADLRILGEIALPAGEGHQMAIVP